MSASSRRLGQGRPRAASATDLRALPPLYRWTSAGYTPLNAKARGLALPDRVVETARRLVAEARDRQAPQLEQLTGPSGEPAWLLYAEAVGEESAQVVVLPVAWETARDDPTAELRPREREVLALLERGVSVDEIGARLGIATNTVRGHLKQVYRTLAVSSRAQAMRLLADSRRLALRSTSDPPPSGGGRPAS